MHLDSPASIWFYGSRDESVCGSENLPETDSVPAIKVTRKIKRYEKSEVILGLHGFSADSRRQMHDAGVCLLVDGEVVSAVDEERLSLAKRDGNFPSRSLEAAFRMSGISAREIDTVAFVDRLPAWQTGFFLRYALEAAL